jgi:hypothetical protein
MAGENAGPVLNILIDKGVGVLLSSRNVPHSI